MLGVVICKRAACTRRHAGSEDNGTHARLQRRQSEQRGISGALLAPSPPRLLPAAYVLFSISLHVFVISLLILLAVCCHCCVPIC
jgi:hypothetical protein